MIDTSSFTGAPHADCAFAGAHPAVDVRGTDVTLNRCTFSDAMSPPQSTPADVAAAAAAAAAAAPAAASVVVRGAGAAALIDEAFDADAAAANVCPVDAESEVFVDALLGAVTICEGGNGPVRPLAAARNGSLSSIADPRAVALQQV